MKKLIGLIQEVSPGVFALKDDNGGNLYALSGGDAGLRQAGAHVQVEGHVEGELEPISGVGAVFLVKRYKIL
jgi:hypothetical protein